MKTNNITLFRSISMRLTKYQLKRGFLILSAYITFFVVSGCNDIITQELETAEPAWVVDAWIDTRNTPQKISISKTNGYFNTEISPGEEVDTVFVTNVTQKSIYPFSRNPIDGDYYWTPSVQESLGMRGDVFELTVVAGNILLSSQTILDSVPAFDSLWFVYEDPWRPNGPPVEQALYLDFEARDLPGPGNTYWIKSFKNGSFRNRPDEINVAFDASFSAGGAVDNVPFIAPIRQLANRLETNSDGEGISPLAIGDTVRLEIHSINLEAFTFLFDFNDLDANADAFSQLFAGPFFDLGSNITGLEGETKINAYGIFNVAMVSEISDVLTQEKANGAIEVYQQK